MGARPASAVQRRPRRRGRPGGRVPFRFLRLLESADTALYNKPPAWLLDAHRALDDAVFAAYGWSPSMDDGAILAALLELNLAKR